MKKQQSGFTLIELVVVIVILGILAATAVPKFIDLSSEAVQAKASGTAGAVASGGAIYFAQQKAGGSTVSAANACSSANVTPFPSVCSVSNVSACAAGVATCDISCTESGQTKTATATVPCG